MTRTLLVGLKGRERKTGAMGKEVLGSELEADKKIETVRGPSSRFPELRTPTFGFRPSAFSLRTATGRTCVSLSADKASSLPAQACAILSPLSTPCVVCLVHLVYLVGLVFLVCFVWLVHLVHLVCSFNQINETNQTDQTNQSELIERVSLSGRVRGEIWLERRA